MLIKKNVYNDVLSQTLPLGVYAPNFCGGVQAWRGSSAPPRAEEPTNKAARTAFLWPTGEKEADSKGKLEERVFSHPLCPVPSLVFSPLFYLGVVSLSCALVSILPHLSRPVLSLPHTPHFFPTWYPHPTSGKSLASNIDIIQMLLMSDYVVLLGYGNWKDIFLPFSFSPVCSCMHATRGGNGSGGGGDGGDGGGGVFYI